MTAVWLATGAMLLAGCGSAAATLGAPPATSSAPSGPPGRRHARCRRPPPAGLAMPPRPGRRSRARVHVEPDGAGAHGAGGRPHRRPRHGRHRRPRPRSPRSGRASARAVSTLGGSVGVAVVDVPSGVLVYSRAATVGMRPASTMKALTATAALTVYGPEKRWPTRVVTARYGNAVHVTIVGGGDPLLSGADLADLAAQVRRRVGRTPVIVNLDDSALGVRAPAPGWRSDYVGQEVTTIGALARFGDYGVDPGRAAGQAFTAALIRAGGNARWGGRAAQRAGSVTMASVPGQPLSTAVRIMLLRSENNIAETLFRHLGVDVAREGTLGRIPSRTGADVARPRHRPDRLEPGRRLRSEPVEPGQRAAARPGAAAGRHREPPPAAGAAGGCAARGGRTGTLAGRYRSGHAACAAGRVHAKTGSLFDTITLAGIAATTSRRAYAFAVLVGRPTPGSNTRAAIDEVVSAVVGC